MAIDIQKITTFTDFVIEEEHRHKSASGNFTLLVEIIARSGKIIGSHVRESGLVDILGKTGRKNTFEEEIQKLDDYSNNLLIKTLSASNLVHSIVSEEEEKPIIIDKEHQGDYVVYFDPLDGSSNIDTNASIGTIFSIYHKKNGLLQKGANQVAAGYIIYGASTMLVYTSGESVNGFTLDPSIGSFLLSHPNIRIPDSGNIYSLNEAYNNRYDLPTQKYLSYLKEKKNITSRYIGSLVADVHRTLIKGGIFLYPKDKLHPDGKLRLMIEANPMSLLITTAGGKALSDTSPILSKIPNHIHERTPLVLGSKENVDEYLSFIK